MEPISFDLKKSLGNLAQFDKAAANSAKNFNANFSTQLAALSSTLQATAAGISASFEPAFAEVEVAAAASAINVDMAFAETVASMDGIFSSASQTMCDGFTEAAAFITDLFGITFIGIDETSLNSALLMNEALGGAVAEITLGLQELQLAGETAFMAVEELSALSAEAATISYADALGLISENFAVTTDAITTNLSDILIASQEAALLIAEAFGITTGGIDTAIQNTQATGSSEFALLSDNAINSSISARDSIFADVAEVETIWTELQNLGTAQFALFSDNATNSSMTARDNIFANVSEIGNSWTDLQDLGTAQFALFSDNAINSFNALRDNIFAGAGEIDAKLSETGQNIERNLKSAFSNTESAFKIALGNMFSESDTQFGNIKTSGQTAANNIGKAFSDKFKEILGNLTQLKTDLDPVLSEIQGLFSTTAQSMKIDFAAATANININLVGMGNQGSQSADGLYTSFKKSCTVFSDTLDIMKDINAVVTFFTTLTKLANTELGKQVIQLGLSIAKHIAHGAAAAASAVAAAASAVASTLGAAAIPIAIGIAAVGAAFAGLKIAGVFADGGFPTHGQMFIAREAGPELVGTIGGRTAVANNDQIVESVSAGVYEANREQNQLLRDVKQLLRVIADKNTSISLDGKVITNTVERVQRERGLNFLGASFV